MQKAQPEDDGSDRVRVLLWMMFIYGTDGSIDLHASVIEPAIQSNSRVTPSSQPPSKLQQKQ
jgi:hypothetical protein